MDENKSTTDLDDAQILNKFNNLMNKYKNQGKMTSVPHTVASTLATASQADQITQAIESDKIPTLTEVVILHPSIIQPQPKRLTPIWQILNAALEDAHIEMDISDRKALAHALEVRLADRNNRTLFSSGRSQSIQTYQE
ncbi:hypothetical protein [Nitrosomonas sp. Nm166]|uniref:hypothetical protein n=1 Tax=Nitrosomonas sp. Nm166 TaxID=1881054 RepID=UPI0008E80A5B|nr:hypothetical protein [Nitrosomonas sp. Nm166]SFE84089.1 hypothetical protein SAMN05428977_103218 [Nitrosomonas sp. Nm166]